MNFGLSIYSFGSIVTSCQKSWFLIPLLHILYTFKEKGQNFKIKDGKSINFALLHILRPSSWDKNCGLCVRPTNLILEKKVIEIFNSNNKGQGHQVLQYIYFSTYMLLLLKLFYMPMKESPYRYQPQQN